MSLNYSNNIIADVRCTGSRLQKGVGQYLLQFVLLFEIRAWTDQVLRFENAIAKVSVGDSQSSFAVLGVPVPESPVFFRTTPNFRHLQWSFEFS